MLEKNKDTLQKDLMVLSESSKQALMGVLFPPSDQKTSKVTLGGQFRKQLDNLMNALNATEPHYIRHALLLSSLLLSPLSSLLSPLL